jgi:ATP/maltotriose-dependent transcriptional regulator MalT
VEVCLYRLDLEHQTFLSELKKAVVDYFGLELCVEIKMRHISAALLGAIYNEKKGVYRIVEKP